METKASGKGPTFYDMLNPKQTEPYEALMFLLPNYFEGCYATAVRTGKGDRKLSHLEGYANSLLMYWYSGRSYEYHFAEFAGTEVDMRHVVGDKYPEVRYIQLLMVSDDNFPVNSTVDSLSSPTAPVSQVDI